MQYAERLPCVSTSGCLATVNRCMVVNGNIKGTDGAVWDQHGQLSTIVTSNNSPTTSCTMSVTMATVPSTTATHCKTDVDSKMQGVQTELSTRHGSFNEVVTKTSEPRTVLTDSVMTGGSGGLSTTASCASAVNEVAKRQTSVGKETLSAQKSCDAVSSGILASPSSPAVTDAETPPSSFLSIGVDSGNAAKCASDLTQSPIPCEKLTSQLTTSVSPSKSAYASVTSLGGVTPSECDNSRLVNTPVTRSPISSSPVRSSKSPVTSPTLIMRSPIKSPTLSSRSDFSVQNVQTITLYTVTSSPSHKNPSVASLKTVSSLPAVTTTTDVTQSASVLPSGVSTPRALAAMSSYVSAEKVAPGSQPASSFFSTSTSATESNQTHVADDVTSMRTTSEADNAGFWSSSQHPSVASVGFSVPVTVPFSLETDPLTTANGHERMASVGIGRYGKVVQSQISGEESVRTVCPPNNSGKGESCESKPHQVTVRPKSLNEGLGVGLESAVSCSVAESSNMKPNSIDDRLSTGFLDMDQPHLRRSDRHSVSSITSDTRSCAGPLQNSDIPPFMVVDRGLSLSQGIEKLLDRTASSNSRGRSGYDNGTGVVRSSWSQENYFDHNDLTCVDIGLDDDDDDLASSVDVLHYRDGSSTSNISLSGQLPSHSWTEDDIDERSASELTSGKLRSWAPIVGDVFAELSSGSSEFSDSKLAPPAPAVDFKRKSQPIQPGICIALAVDLDDVTCGFSTVDDRCVKDEVSKASNVLSESASKTESDNSFPSSALPILATRPTAKDVDRPSAARLAKRLFYLHGFQKADVLRHLTKRNSFSQLVGEEFLKFFDFTNEKLDSALRHFVKHLAMSSKLQDRDQLLLHFARRYYECNSDTYKSEDCCHTLACALVLLNTDLHCQTSSRSMTLSEFVVNLAEMNEGDDFPEDLLTAMYESIREEPLQFERDDTVDNSMVNCGSSPVVLSSPQNTAAAQSRYNASGFSNTFLEIPTDSNDVKEYKKGYVMRKCCVEPDGRKTPLGKRGWKMFYLTLRDMTLCMYNDENSYKRATHCSNTIRIHHALATKAGDYVKKKHVFRLQTADLAQYLIQTSDSRECQEWMDTINFIAASYSAPCQFKDCNVAAISGSQKRFQRPLLPLSYTTLNLKDQIGHQESMIAQFERELLEHRKDPPEKGARSRIIHEYCKTESFLKFELKRYKTYVRLLQYKLAAFSELEPSLVETVIGEVDESSTSPSHVTANVQFNLDLAEIPVGTENLSINDAVLDTVPEV